MKRKEERERTKRKKEKIMGGREGRGFDRSLIKMRRREEKTIREVMRREQRGGR